MKQAIGIPIGIDHASFWANHFLYSYKEEFMRSLIYSHITKASHFRSTKHSIDDLYAINDGGEFGKSLYVIHPKELEVKVEDQGDHAMFLNLDITIKEGTFYI